MATMKKVKSVVTVPPDKRVKVKKAKPVSKYHGAAGALIDAMNKGVQ